MIFRDTITISAGDESNTIAHGFGKSPTDIQLTPQDDLAGRDYWATKDATNVTVHINSMDPFNDHAFFVEAYVSTSAEDPLIALYDLIKSNWSVSESGLQTIGGTSKDILLSTGWYDEDFQGPQITITEIDARDQPFELGYGTVRVFAVYQIDIWVPISRASSKGPGLAKKWRWTVREEVKDILKANLTGVGDLKYVILDQAGRNLDELDRGIPVLRCNLPISVIYDL